MTKEISISDLFKAEKALKQLVEQDLEYHIGTAYKIHCLLMNVSEISTYSIERFVKVCGNDVDFNNMTDIQTMVYEGIITSKVYIDNYGLSMNDVLGGKNVRSTVSYIDALSKVLD